MNRWARGGTVPHRWWARPPGPSRAALPLLGALLGGGIADLAAQGSASNPDRLRPVLGAHRFVPNEITRDPFSRTYVRNALGVGRALDTEFLPSLEIEGGDTIPGLSGDLLLALLDFETLADQAAKREIELLTGGYPDKAEFFVEKLAHGVAMIAAAFYPKDVIVRMSDFKSNEYANLIGGRPYEPVEENPMMGPALMQQRREGFYLLEQAGALQHRRPSEAVETAMQVAKMAPAHEMPMAEAPAGKAAHAAAPVEPAPATTEPALAPVPEGPVADAHAEAAAKVTATGDAKLPAAGAAMHLAYKGESAAKRGWKILLGEYDELDPLSPLYVTVDVPGKGEVIRLYATGAEPAEISRICAAL